MVSELRCLSQGMASNQETLKDQVSRKASNQRSSWSQDLQKKHYNPRSKKMSTKNIGETLKPSHQDLNDPHQVEEIYKSR